MSGRGHLKFTPELTEYVTTLLAGQRPTAPRVMRLLKELTTKEDPMDQSDLEHGRVPVRRVTIDPDAGAARLAEAQRRRPRETVVEEAPVDVLPVSEELPVAEPAPAETTPPPEPSTSEPPVSEADDAAVEALKESIAGGVFRAHMEGIERKALGRVPKLMKAASRQAMLEEAAAILLAEMQPNHQDAVNDIARDMSYPRWAVILGAVAHMADLQELASGNFEEQWVNDPARGQKATPKTLVCEHCQTAIPNPSRPGQRFCCNRHGSGQDAHSDGCDLKHVLKIKDKWVVIEQLKGA